MRRPNPVLGRFRIRNRVISDRKERCQIGRSGGAVAVGAIIATIMLVGGMGVWVSAYPRANKR
jgi:hypothetical protein